jgi:hypothetical protein
VEKELSAICDNLLKIYSEDLIASQAKANRVYDFKMKTELCEERTGLCGEGKAKAGGGEAEEDEEEGKGEDEQEAAADIEL